MWRVLTTLAALTFAFLQCLPAADAVTFPLYSRRRSDPVTQSLLKRVEITSAVRSVLRNYGDNSYWTIRNVGDASFQVLIDTGRYGRFHSLYLVVGACSDVVDHAAVRICGCMVMHQIGGVGVGKLCSRMRAGGREVCFSATGGVLRGIE